MVERSRQIFISYARSDANRVEWLVEGLRQLRFDVWLDRELTGGQAWWDAVLSQIRASTAVLITVSPAALESVAVRREYEYGHALGRPLLPVVVDTVHLQLLPPLLAPLHVVDYHQPETKNAFALAAAVANLPIPQPLPEPLPEPPPIPISYLSELKERSHAATLSMDEQLALVAQLKDALERASEREAAEEVLRSLQNRNDLYQLSAREIESLLSPHFRQAAASRPQEASSARMQGSWTGKSGAHEQNPVRAARLLADAERIAYSVDSAVRQFALADVAVAVAAIDPDRAELIIRSIDNELWSAGALADVVRTLAATDPNRAERIAQSISDEYQRVSALADVATTLAATQPDSAERIAQSIDDQYTRTHALTNIAETLVATDPERAARLFAHAERIAYSITEEASKDNALIDIAYALAGTDPDRAVSIARSINDKWSKASSVANVARVLAATDPDRAERIAQSITDRYSKASALADVATMTATIDPQRAEHIAQSINDKYSNAIALAGIAKTVAATNPIHAARLIADAERIANSTSTLMNRLRGGSDKDSALQSITEALAVAEPDRAERIAQSITDQNSKARSLTELAKTLAAADPDRAVRIAESITDEESRNSALVDVAKTLAATNSERAERIAQSITDKIWKVRALVGIARAVG